MSPRPGSKGALNERVRQRVLLERLCARFPLVAEQLRTRPAGRPGFVIQDDQDVGDLLHALLTLEHDGLQREAWTPSYAAGPRADSRLIFEQIVVTARLAPAGGDAPQLAAHLAEDAHHYQGRPGCATLAHFIYDPEGNLAEPRALEHALSQAAAGLTVRVFIAPHRL